MYHLAEPFPEPMKLIVFNQERGNWTWDRVAVQGNRIPTCTVITGTSFPILQMEESTVLQHKDFSVSSRASCAVSA